MFELETYRKRLGKKQFNRVTLSLAEACEDELLATDLNPVLQAETAVEHCGRNEVRNPEIFLAMYDHVVELGVLAAVLLARVECEVEVMDDWDLKDRLSLVSAWIVLEADMLDYSVDWIAHDDTIDLGVAAYASLQPAA